MKNKKLAKMLIEKNIKQVELAEKTGISKTHVHRIISGKSNGSVKWWKEAAEILGVDVSEIL